MLPFQQTVERRDPYTGAAQSYPDVANVREPMDIRPAAPNDPIRDTDFQNQGKPYGHAWPHRVAWISTAIKSWLSVDAWPADGVRAEKVIRRNIVSTPRGLQAAFVERVNIERPASTPFGSMAAQPGFDSTSILEMRGLRR